VSAAGRSAVPFLRTSPGRVAAGAAAGLILLAAFPPTDQRWVAVPALVPLLLALRGASWRQGLAVGFAHGAVFFGLLLWWISGFGLVAWAGLAVVLALFSGVYGALAARAAALGVAGRILGIPLLWIGIEMMRGRLPYGGFTWGGLGYSQQGGGPLLALARIGGVHLVGLALVVAAALLAEALMTVRGPGRRWMWATGGALLIVLAPALLPVGLAGPQAGTMDIAAIQGNVPRGIFTGVGRGRTGPEDLVIIRNHIEVTRRLLGEPPPDLVIWPENAFDRDPFRNAELFEPVQGLARAVGSPFVIGAILEGDETFRNSNLYLDVAGRVQDVYDKVHLVPFGEYVPFAFARDLVPILDREIPVDGTPGDRVVVFDTPAGRVGTVICFESTFPELVRASVRGGAQVIVVTTNNASYGTSPASAQHLAMSRVRAIEHGRPLIQAAISGISAIVMPDGEIVERAGLFTPALLRAEVPLTTGTTPYTRYGSGIEIAMGIGAAAAAAAGMVRARGRRA